MSIMPKEQWDVMMKRYRAEIQKEVHKKFGKTKYCMKPTFFKNRTRSKALIKHLNCMIYHIKTATDLHLEYGSIFRCKHQLEYMSEDLELCFKILKRLDIIEANKWKIEGIDMFKEKSKNGKT